MLNFSGRTGSEIGYRLTSPGRPTLGVYTAHLAHRPPGVFVAEASVGRIVGSGHLPVHLQVVERYDRNLSTGRNRRIVGTVEAKLGPSDGNTAEIAYALEVGSHPLATAAVPDYVATELTKKLETLVAQ